MEKRIVIALLTISAFVLAKNGGKLLRLLDAYATQEVEVRGVVYKCCWYVVFPLLVLGIFHGFKKMRTEAGLADRALEGIRTGFVGTLPMLLGAGLLVGFKMDFDPAGILVGCLLAAVGEELLYRAMLFGQLFRHARWGFLWAGMASAVIFGAGHLYQGNDAASLIGVFIVTFMGGMWFAWLYVEWGYNLWVPMSYHFFMNLSWNIFDVSDNALGAWAPNVFRAATIALSIVLTLRRKRQMGEALEVKGRRWWSGDGAGIAAAKQLAVAILLASPIFAAAQNERVLAGKVTDEHGHELAYVNIGVLGTSVGTVSGLDGSFQLFLSASVGDGDSLRFSAIGHESLTWSVAGYLAALGGSSATIALPAATTELPTVEVRPRFAKRKTIGLSRSKFRTAVHFAISDKPNQNLGAEIGRKFNLPKGQVQLDSVRFFVSQNNFDTVRLRVNVYQLDGRPSENLLNENIVVELKPQQRGWVKVDLQPYNLVVNEDVVVAVEWIYHGGKGKSLSLPIGMLAGAVHFYKYGSQGRWKKFPGMSSAMELVVSY
jgi:membrane protease YdiL (CAAX protease family)